MKRKTKNNKKDKKGESMKKILRDERFKQRKRLKSVKGRKRQIFKRTNRMKRILTILITPMGVLTPGSAHTRPCAWLPINMSGHFLVHLSGGALTRPEHA